MDMTEKQRIMIKELEDFMSCYKGFYDLIDTLMDRW